MTEFFADLLKFYQLHPGWLFVTATLLPLLSFALIFLASGAWALLRRYRDDHPSIEQLYNLFGGDKSGRTAAYIATAAIGIAFILSLTGFILFTFVDGDKEQKRDEQEAKIRETRELLVLINDNDKELEKSLRDKEAELTAIDARWAGRFDWLRIAPALTNDPQRGTALQLGFRIDSLAAIMFVMVTFIATLIHLFSIGYMADELPETVEDHQVHGEHGHLHRRGRFGRFFMYLSLFCFSMLNLVLADNLFQVFVSWELVGLCSYLLVGFYFERKSAANAANKAFIVNRVGDAGFIIGLMILWTYVGTFNFEDLFRQIRAPLRDAQGGLVLGGQFVRTTPRLPVGLFEIAGQDQPISSNTLAVLFPRDPEAPLHGTSEQLGGVPTGIEKGAWLATYANPGPKQFGYMPYWMLVLAGLGIFLGCCGKSAQFPLQVWLPDAMEGPTPVSALIHAATMVAAGVYLVGRCYPLFTPEVLLVIAYVGGITLFIAATIAVVMTDIKKVLAYSTVSQLGYLMLAMGVGGWTASLFHLITHAFFKALLFLCSGAVIYNCHHEQDMTKMGGLFPKMKITALTMLAGCLAISGVPGFSGWYSKDAILAQAFGFVWVHPGHVLLFLLPLVTAGITTFYMFRMWFLTFAGRPRDEHVYEHAHEAPWIMTIPLIVLAVFSVCVAWGRQPWNPEESFLAENISESQPASVIADFGRVENDPLWKGGRLKDEENSERYLARENHALAGNLALGVVALGLIFAALLYYYRVFDSEESKEQFATLHGFLWNKWYFDELYSAMVVRPGLVIAHWFAWFDLTVIDGIIHFVAFATVRVSKWDGLFDHNIIDGMVNVVGGAVSRVGNGLRGVETGSLRNYVLFLVLAAVGIFLLLTWWVAMVMAGQFSRDPKGSAGERERIDMPSYMYEWDFIWMTLVVFIPSVFALGLLFFPRGKDDAMRWWSLIGTALTLGVSLGMFINFKNDTVDSSGVIDKEVRLHATLQTRAETADSLSVASPARSHDWVTRYPWIANFHIDYYLGADGISMALVLLTTALCFLAMIASWKIDKFVRGYCILFLILETGMLGTFLALDFFLFYIFWEVMLLPMYFLIGVWGGPRREYAAIKFFLYTLLGSVFILIALLAFYFTNVRDFVTPERLEAAASGQGVAAYDNAEKAVVAADAARNQTVDKTEPAVKDWNAAADEFDKAEAALVEAQNAFNNEDDAKKKADLKVARDEAKGRRDEAFAARQKVKGPYDKAEQDREAAERRLEMARIKMATELAKVPIVVNSFDLILLQRVGKAAQEFLRGSSISAPLLDAAEKTLAGVQEKVNRGEGGYTQADVAAAEANVTAARDGLYQRLHSEAFFTPSFQYAMFLFLFIGFAVKVPIFPLHTWLPDAHVEAPTPISMILAGVLLKLGAYGIIRIAYPICPWAAEQLALWVALLGIINIVYGAFAAMAQTDFKKLVAYSSVSHMGYVILGIAVWSSGQNSTYWAWGMNGAVFQMIAHGITSAGMFFMVGVIYDRAHHRNLDNFRGLYEPMPLYGGIAAVLFFAAMGLPGMCGFVGEFMVVLSAWNFAPGGHQAVGIVFSVLAALTVVITAAYILWTIQRVFMGQNPAYKNYKDMNYREVITAVPLLVGAVLFGVAPFLITTWLEPSVTGLVDALASFK